MGFKFPTFSMPTGNLAPTFTVSQPEFGKLQRVVEDYQVIELQIYG